MTKRAAGSIRADDLLQRSANRVHRGKVVYFTNSFPAVSQTFVTDQIATLIDAGVDVEIHATERVSSEPVDDRVKGMLSRTHFAASGPAWRSTQLLPRPLRWRARDILTARARRRALRDADLAICHFGHIGLSAIHASSRSKSRAAVWTIFHGFDMSSWLKTRGEGAYRPLFERGDRFFAISRLWLHKLQALGCPPHRLSLLRMGVDVEAIPFAPRAIAADEAVRFLSVGRLVEKKGTEFILRALGRLRSEEPMIRWRFTIVGDGPLRPTLEALVATLGIASQVKFVGAVPATQVKHLLTAAHVFALPSVTDAAGEMEGIPVALMEAMAAGVSVVSTVHSGIPELIEHGVSGLLAPERDVDALFAHLRTICTDAPLRRSMLDNARATVVREFNQATIARSFSQEVLASLPTHDSAKKRDPGSGPG